MNRQKLAKLKARIANLRRRVNNLRHKDLESIALALGRIRFPRGKEPTYITDVFNAPPISIPDHPGNIKRGTATNILDALEMDIYRYEQLLTEKAKGNGHA
jgi:hypothetical protein